MCICKHCNNESICNNENTCNYGDGIDFSKKVIYGLDKYLLCLIKNNQLPTEYIKDNLEKFDGKIIVMNDVSCGVVPVDKHLRLWREEVGRCMVIFAKKSEEVYRIYCGIDTRIK